MCFSFSLLARTALRRLQRGTRNIYPPSYLPWVWRTVHPNHERVLQVSSRPGRGPSKHKRLRELRAESSRGVRHAANHTHFFKHVFKVTKMQAHGGGGGGSIHIYICMCVDMKTRTRSISRKSCSCIQHMYNKDIHMCVIMFCYALYVGCISTRHDA